MNDVARLAGVGLKTVSRVVNGEPRVSEAMAEKVRAAIEQLGYSPHEGARLLRRGQTACIGLVLEDVANPFYSALVGAVEQVARANGFLLFTASSEEDAEEERELTLAFCARRVDGLVIVPAAAANHRYLEPEIDAGVVAVFVDRPAVGIAADAVLSDNVGGTRAAVAHLLRHGHRRIGYIGDAVEIFTASERLRGYRDELSDSGLPFDESLVAMGHPEPEFVRTALDRMLGGAEPVTALIAGNNRATVTVLRELSTRHQELALVGFDDFEFADLLNPGVTVIAHDPAALGRTAADLLFRRLQGYRGPVQTIEIATRLVPRGSGETTR
jgi:LacI family transcriptional regulator